MLGLLLLSPAYLGFVQSVFIPPIVGNTTALAPIPTDTSFIHFATIINPPSNACKDIDNCQTVLGILWSCLGTIFACVWVAVHRNIPEQKQTSLSKCVHPLLIIVATVLSPELILAWVVRQYSKACKLVQLLEAARKNAEATWDEQRSRVAIGLGGRSTLGGAKRVQTVYESVGERKNDEISLMRRQPTSVDACAVGAASEEAQEKCQFILSNPGLVFISYVVTMAVLIATMDPCELNSYAFKYHAHNGMQLAPEIQQQ